MGLFRRKPKDFNEQLMEEAAAQRGPADVTPGWSGGDSGGANLAGLDESELAQVHVHLKLGKKIEAIKIYKEATGAGLKESKEAVEAIAVGQAAQVAAAPVPHAATDSEVLALARDGKLIDAIKLYREIHGTGLKESKDAVDAMLAGG